MIGLPSHARRKFVDAQKLAPAIAIEALELIGKLFAIEERAKSLSCADRLALRQMVVWNSERYSHGRNACLK
jgi:hypothetical protein